MTSRAMRVDQSDRETQQIRKGLRQADGSRQANHRGLAARLSQEWRGEAAPPRNLEGRFKNDAIWMYAPALTHRGNCTEHAADSALREPWGGGIFVGLLLSESAVDQGHLHPLTPMTAKTLGLFRQASSGNSSASGLSLARTADKARLFLIGGGAIYLLLWIYGLVIDRGSDANFVPLEDRN